MKFFFFFLFLGLYAYAQNEEQAILSAQGKKMMQTEQKTAQQGIATQTTANLVEQQHQKQVAASAAGGGTSDIMIIDPQVLAQDWVNAYSVLQSKRVAGISFVVRDGPPISNVSAIEPLPGGYLMLFTVKTLQGYQYQIVKTSTITTILSK